MKREEYRNDGTGDLMNAASSVETLRHRGAASLEASEGPRMSHIAHFHDDPNHCGELVGFDPDGEAIAGQPICAQAAPATQRLAAIGEMTGGIAHDFRNLLTVIGAAIKMAESSSGQPERARACLAGAREGVDRGLKLTSELLMFAARRERDEAGGSEIGLHDVNVCLRKLERLLKYAAGPGVHVVLELASDIPSCVVDPLRFDDAILNLVVNARDAMSGSGEILISTQLCPEPAAPGRPNPRTCVRVRLEDNGEGMTWDVLQKVFDPFFTTKGTKGTGLGLPQVHEFMREMGGHIKAASEPGIGTAIDLFFALASHEASS
jgi:signal transduction histidine kinase